eukprot:scaffold127989_cov51-Prasinocladus_malaysianus.AAC.1
MDPKGREAPAVAGAIAGAIVTAVLHPVDTIKVLLQADHNRTRSIPNVIFSSIKQRGYRALYSGIVPSIATSMPISALYTFTYEACKTHLGRLLPREHTWAAQAVAGACASIATSFVYTPSECIKSRLQIGLYLSPQQVRKMLLASNLE